MFSSIFRRLDQVVFAIILYRYLHNSISEIYGDRIFNRSPLQSLHFLLIAFAGQSLYLAIPTFFLSMFLTKYYKNN